MKCYSAMKKNEIMPFAATWVYLEIVILREVSQTEKDKSNIICYHLYVDSKQNHTNELIYKTETDSNRLVLSVVLIIKWHLQVTCLLTRFPLIKAHCHTA